MKTWLGLETRPPSQERDTDLNMYVRMYTNNFQMADFDQ